MVLLVVAGAVVLLVVVFVKAASLQALPLGHGGGLRQCLKEGLKSGVVEVQRRLQKTRHGNPTGIVEEGIEQAEGRGGRGRGDE